MRQHQGILARLFLMVAAGASPVAAQQAAPSVSAGTLTCDIAPGVALIVDSPKDLRCVLYRTDGTQQAYGGRLTGGGLNVGVTGRRVVAWSVTSSSGAGAPFDISGRYTGLQAGAAIGVGGTGGGVLRSAGTAVSLEPLDVQRSSGVNIALGATQMDLSLLGAPRLPATAGPVPAVPAETYQQSQPAPELATPDYTCGSEARLQASQTLFGLASACGVSLGALLEANPQITNVRNVSVGAAISIPQSGRATRVGRCDKRTIVKSGQTVSGVAAQCGVSTQALASANAGLARGVVPGQVLTIPDPRDTRVAVAQPSEPQQLSDIASETQPEQTTAETASEPDPSVEVPLPQPVEQTPQPDPETDRAAPQPVVETPAPDPTVETPYPPVAATPDAGLPPPDKQPVEQPEVAQLPRIEDDYLSQPERESNTGSAVSEERLKTRCQESASRQLGLLVYQVIARDVKKIDDTKYAVTLDANSRQVTCLVDPYGQVASVQAAGIRTGSLPSRPIQQEAILSRLPDGDRLVMMELTATAEARQTGTIQGYSTTAYAFSANQDQSLIITLDCDKADCFFNVVRADAPYGEALFAGQDAQSRRATVRIPSAGIYLIRPYLRDAAQDNQVANYTLTASTVEKGVPPSPDQGQAMDLSPSGKQDRLIQAY